MNSTSKLVTFDYRRIICFIFASMLCCWGLSARADEVAGGACTTGYTAGPNASGEILKCVGSVWIVVSGSGGLTATDRISTTNVSSGATLGMVVADKGTVSFTLGGTAGAAYLHPTLGFVGSGVSTTGPISGTGGYYSGNVGIGTVPSSTVRLSLETSDLFGVSFKSTGTGPTGLVHIENTNVSTAWNFGIETGIGWANGTAGNLYIDQDTVGPRITLTPTGLVGLTLITPTTRLDVQGNITARPDESGQGLRIFGRLSDGFSWAPLMFNNSGTTFAGGMWYMPSRVALTAGPSLTEVMTWMPSGKVGIGTSNPTEQLTLKGVGPNIGLYDTTSGATDTIQNSSGGLILNTGGGNSIIFQLGGSEKMRVNTSTGNVGIGITNPQYPLHVFAAPAGSSTPYDVAALEVSPTGARQVGFGPSLMFRDPGGVLATNMGRIAAVYENATFTRAGLSFYTTIDNNTPVENMRISAAGYVGIGTAAPSTTLHVYAGGAPSVLQLQTGMLDLALAAVRYKGGNANTDWYVGTNRSDFFGAADSFGFYKNSGTIGTKMVITDAGNVGIGTTSPSYLLHVNGTAYATGAAGALSDRRHKANITTLPDGALGLVERLRPVSFTWQKPTDAGMKGEQIGFIAQEVEKVLPSVVLTQADADKTKGLKYTEIIPVLTKAIQELKAENDNLERRLRALESKSR